MFNSDIAYHCITFKHMLEKAYLILNLKRFLILKILVIIFNFLLRLQMTLKEQLWGFSVRMLN